MTAYFFELLPVLLAMVAGVLCAARYRHERRTQMRAVLLLGVVCALLLIVAQASWWSSHVVEGLQQGQEFANALWTLFNSLAMLAFIVAAKPGSRCKP